MARWFRRVVLKGAEPNTELLWEGPEGDTKSCVREKIIIEKRRVVTIYFQYAI